MELRTIRYFVAVAEAGSVTAGARAIHISQPSLSRQLHQLEAELGLELFTHREGRLALSPGGRQFLPAARELLARAEAARAAAAGIRAGSMPTITVAAPAVTLNDVLAPFFATFAAGDPTPLVADHSPREEYAALERGADLVIGTRPPPGRLAGSAVARLPVFAYVPSGHALADRERVALAELVTHDLLVLSPDAHSRRALDAALEADGLGPGTLTEFSSSQVAQAVAAAGRGVAVVSDDPRFGLRPVLVETSGGTLRVHLYAAWLPHHHAAGQLAALVRRLERFVAERYPA